MKLYHGTAGENVAGILKRGVKPRRVTGKNNWKHTVASNPHAVYLTSAYGGYFAHQAAKTSLLGIVEVDTHFLDRELFRPDEDFLEQATRESKKLEPSLKRVLRSQPSTTPTMLLLMSCVAERCSKPKVSSGGLATAAGGAATTTAARGAGAAVAGTVGAVATGNAS